MAQDLQRETEKGSALTTNCSQTLYNLSQIFFPFSFLQCLIECKYRLALCLLLKAKVINSSAAQVLRKGPLPPPTSHHLLHLLLSLSAPSRRRLPDRLARSGKKARRSCAGGNRCWPDHAVIAVSFMAACLPWTKHSLMCKTLLGLQH